MSIIPPTGVQISRFKWMYPSALWTFRYIHLHSRWYKMSHMVYILHIHVLINYHIHVQCTVLSHLWWYYVEISPLTCQISHEPWLSFDTLSRTQKQATGASAYAKSQNVSVTTMNMFEEMEQMNPQLNYGVVQSAATSSEFVSRALVKQKKRNKK